MEDLQSSESVSKNGNPSKDGIQSHVSKVETVHVNDTLIKHYELPNLTNLLYEYTNKEQEMVAQAFRTGNYRYLRDLPDEIAPNKVLEGQAHTIEDNLSHNSEKAKKRYRKLFGGGMFQEFEWVPDDYNSFLDQQRKEREDMKNRQLDLRPFVSGSKPKKEKYEPQLGVDNIFPFMYTEDPYESSKDEILRAKWIEESKILHGAFKPSFMDKCIENVNKAQLPDIVILLRKRIAADWPEARFIIGSNPEEYIEIKFDTETVDSLLGLHAYMNSLISSDELIKQFKLKKVIQNWGIKEGSFAYYMICPPWIRLDLKDTYYALYPEKIVKNSIGNKFKSTSLPSNASTEAPTEDDERKPAIYSREIAL